MLRDISTKGFLRKALLSLKALLKFKWNSVLSIEKKLQLPKVFGDGSSSFGTQGESICFMQYPTANTETQ